MGQRVSELMTVLSAGAESTEMEQASMFSSTTPWQAKSRWAEQNKTGRHLADCRQSAEVMDD